MDKYKFRFIDLFAGIGGFHQAMRFLGGNCVMAAEINKACIETYKVNYKKTKDIRDDVRKIDPKSIPQFDVLCAGFPCQPFSKAGEQKGFQDKTRGNLFYIIMDILDHHKEAKFVILENVRNLADKSENWDIIKNELMKRNFYITESPIILSPSNFGIPQIRERVYMLKENPTVIQRYRRENDRGHECIIPPISYYEVRRGLLAANATAKMKAFDRLCKEFSIGKMDISTWDEAAQIYAAMRKQGRPIEDADLFIAAFCITNEYTLVTNNTKRGDRGPAVCKLDRDRLIGKIPDGFHWRRSGIFDTSPISPSAMIQSNQ